MDLSLVIMEILWLSPAPTNHSAEQIHPLRYAPNSRFFQNKSILGKQYTTEFFCSVSILAVWIMLDPIPVSQGI